MGYQSCQVSTIHRKQLRNNREKTVCVDTTPMAGDGQQTSTVFFMTKLYSWPSMRNEFSPLRHGRVYCYRL